MTSREDVNRLAAASAELIAMARRDLRDFLASLNLGDPDAAKAALIDIVPLLVREYGDLSAIAAAEWYEEIRAASGARGAFAARLSDGIEPERVEASVGNAVGALWRGDPERTLSELEGALQRHIRYSSRDTVRQNIRNDPAKPRYARVPRGRITCAFCTILASRGYVYLTAKSAGKEDPSHYHDDCNCEIVAEFDAEQAHIAGYDPDAMYEKYAAAVDATGGSYDPNELTKALRRLYPDDVTDGVQPRVD